MASLKIETLATGNELLDGSIVDTNAQRLALAIKPLGLMISQQFIVPDDLKTIESALHSAVKRKVGIVIVSGGLGPTNDDLTLEVASRYAKRKLIYSKDAEKNVLARLKKLNRNKNAGHEKQCWIPQGAKVLENREGTAPGIELKVKQTRFFFLPGVPREYDYILQKSLLPVFKKISGAGIGTHLFILKVFGYAESALHQIVFENSIPKNVTVGFRTALPENHIKFFIEAKTRESAKKSISGLVSLLRKRLGNALFAFDSETFEESIFISLKKKNIKVTLAESCTGGLTTSLLTKVSGSSQVLDRSFITYSNEAKEQMLGVSSETLRLFGAVSEQTAVEMAEGALKSSAASRAVAITGIAGPTGGTNDKPVGTVWIAAVSKTKKITKKLSLPFDRDLNQKWSAYEALCLLRDIDD